MLSLGHFFSSDEDDEAYTECDMSALRKEIRQNSDIFAMPNSNFIGLFRLNKDAFKYVLESISGKLQDPIKSSAVPKELKLAVTLRILAEGSYQKGAGNDYNVGLSQSSVSKIFTECIDAMHSEICPKWISVRMTEVEKFEIKDYFYKKFKFPGIIGCIDGTHIKILAPGVGERFKYYNRKGFYSLNATVCDHKLRIRYISPNHPGSVHDSLVWNTSDLKEFLKTNYLNGETNTWLLGDAGYPLEPYLITPFRSAEDGTAESRFNYIHSQARNVVERTIGVLKNRFRCILGARQLHYKPKMAGKITSVCAALHNICIHYKIESAVEPNESTEIPSNEAMSNLNETSEDATALNIRRRIMQSLDIY
ncbi:putative nuclease HARBI1 isoform X2 [Stomoxys calcitrans]|uniref:DDE Tnp4 domain-containing protein n=1 Tax=Stomoxys calcitrans TaxID=35570 RepID=A0A1I8P0U1_STOCA|nr:putative nuclease HARBI1 isoform X2 [Stomoxys calcitrans]XP_059217277.1 putative nuclease HARBI1 isoform X2 [Stomoxys calcitrans]XP_059219714.1 putative nuclease HARBI1 isoform X2 [Stomoxys calcitrans]XP_059221036.1 putative nuclease HARBI1 isoform X2 [Stomoxys calcitrans]XP_059222251.1 putative nuclease HARBI1 isoform X2 [Stomoxys calcitrans]XP_059222316.1 putative nuclease HARBI1 isoform X2 [Stomoxys calcitrans]XP_059224097.1 putative nuclease HARBI1 isoform X2 [Stomoxys calcitrans]XP_0